MSVEFRWLGRFKLSNGGNRPSREAAPSHCPLQSMHSDHSIFTGERRIFFCFGYNNNYAVKINRWVPSCSVLMCCEDELSCTDLVVSHTWFNQNMEWIIVALTFSAIFSSCRLRADSGQQNWWRCVCHPLSLHGIEFIIIFMNAQNSARVFKILKWELSSFLLSFLPKSFLGLFNPFDFCASQQEPPVLLPSPLYSHWELSCPQRVAITAALWPEAEHSTQSQEVQTTHAAMLYISSHWCYLCLGEALADTAFSPSSIRRRCAQMDGESQLCRCSLGSSPSAGILVTGATHAAWVFLRLTVGLLRTRFMVLLRTVFLCSHHAENQRAKCRSTLQSAFLSVTSSTCYCYRDHGGDKLPPQGSIVLQSRSRFRHVVDTCAHSCQEIFSRWRFVAPVDIASVSRYVCISYLYYYPSVHYLYILIHFHLLIVAIWFV